MLKRRRGLLIRAAALVVGMELGTFLLPTRAHAATRLMCGGPICVTVCLQGSGGGQCDYLTDGLCPEFWQCTYEPTCDPFPSGGLAVMCSE